MQLTQRDLALFEFINQFGFCETLHLSLRFNLKPKRVNKVTRRLVEQGYLIKEKDFYGKHALYRLTPKSAQFTALPPLSKLALGQYKHTKSLIHLYLKLRKHYPDAQWISERTLISEKCADGVGEFGHIPDAILQLNDKHIAIEVELTCKNKKRLAAIVKGYTTNFSVQEVWYFCAKEVLSSVKKVAGHLPYIKIHELHPFLGANHHEQ